MIKLHQIEGGGNLAERQPEVNTYAEQVTLISFVASLTKLRRLINESALYRRAFMCLLWFFYPFYSSRIYVVSFVALFSLMGTQ